MESFNTFSEYVYKRPDVEALKTLISEAEKELEECADETRAVEIYDRVHSEMQHFVTVKNICHIRNTIDMTDAYYEAEDLFLSEKSPEVRLILQSFNKAVLASPFLGVLKQKYGDLFFERLQKLMKLDNEANIGNLVEESRLVQKYHRTAAEPVADFHGEKLNFYGLLKKMQDTDRKIRKEALSVWSDLYESISGELDDIYSQLIENRIRQAEVLGFKDYTEMMYLVMERFDYDRRDVAGYREKIRKFVVPVVAGIFEERKKNLKLDHLYYYDEAMTSPDGNAIPKGTSEELVALARRMYHELSPETGEFFDFTIKHGLYDLETRPGKQQGGYCCDLPDIKACFIFSNFNGTSADVDVLTHEAGHAFEGYTALRQGVPEEITFPTSEVAEIHSMSMEFLTYPWMELFFGEKADQYRKAHLEDALKVIPYMACVDEFQHVVYEKKMTDAKDRYALWHSLEEKYMPWRDYGDIEFLNKGGFWLQKQHIFMCPFYYIDYSLASMGAFEYFLKSLKDRESTWKDYYALCCAGGSRGYKKLLKAGNLADPFAEDTVKELMVQLRKLLV